MLTCNHRKQCMSSKYRPQYEPQPRAAKRMSQHHSHCRPLSSTGKSTFLTSTNIESFINFWTFYKMMQYVAAFVPNFLDSKLCLGFTHDVVYCSTLFSFITVEYAFEWSHGHVLINSTDNINLSCFQFLTTTNMILQLTMTMSLGANMCYFPFLTLGHLFSFS